MTRTLLVLALLAAACGGSGKQAKAVPDEATATHRPTPRLGEDEEEPDDGVEIEGRRGILQPGQIQPVLSRHGGKLEDCFTSSAAKLPYVGGRVELKFRVLTDGTVKTVQVSSGDLGAWPVEKCILGVARAMQFPEPKGGEAEFSFPIDFPARSPATALDEARAQAELEPHLADLAACGGAPPVLVTVYVGVKGEVISAGFVTPGEEPFTDEWADCALAKALAWTLTDPRGRVVKAQSWYRP